MMRMAIYLCAPSPQNPQPQSNREENNRLIPIEGLFIKYLKLFKMSRSSKTRKQRNLRNCHSQDEPEETGQLNGTLYPGWDPRTENSY